MYLESVGDAICPLIVTAEHALDDTDGDQLADTPARVAPCCQVTT